MLALYFVLASLIGAAVTGGYGYFKGYQVCNQTQQVLALKAEIKRLNLSKAYKESSLEAANQVMQENDTIIQENQKLIDSLTSDISNEQAKTKAVANSCTIDSSFLQRTDNIK